MNTILILGMAAYGAFLWFLLYHEIHLFSHDIDSIIANQAIMKKRLENGKTLYVYLVKDESGEYMFFEIPSKVSNRWICASGKAGYIKLSDGEIQRLTEKELTFQDAPIKFLLPCQ